MNYYSSASPYKTFKHHAYPHSAHPKQSSALDMELPQRYQQSAKSNRNKDYINNVALLSKDRYKEQVNQNDARYIDDESGNYTEDNLDDPEEEGMK